MYIHYKHGKVTSIDQVRREVCGECRFSNAAATTQHCQSPGEHSAYCGLELNMTSKEELAQCGHCARQHRRHIDPCTDWKSVRCRRTTAAAAVDNVDGRCAAAAENRLVVCAVARKKQKLARVLARGRVGIGSDARTPNLEGVRHRFAK